MKNRTIPGFDLANLTINGKTYALKDPPARAKRRLTLSLVRAIGMGGSSDQIEQEWQHIRDRAHALRTAFTYRFPYTKPFREATRIESSSQEWVYVLPEAEEPHIAWARAARDCGLIDNFSVDYGT